MKIEIWSDFACPFCYIGITKLEKALKSFEHKNEVEVIYRSYELNPNAEEVVEDKGHVAFAKAKGIPVNDAKKMFDQVAITAKASGLDYKMSEILMTSTRKAHRLAKWAKTKGKEQEFSELVFSAYFTKGLNISDNNVLLGFIEKLGLDVKEAKDVLEKNLFDNVVTKEIKEGLNLGVKGVPFFVFNRKFAISGAQPDQHFVDALKRAYEEKPILEQVNEATDDACGEGGCAI